MSDIDYAMKLAPIIWKRNAQGALQVPMSTADDDKIIREWIDRHGAQFKAGNIPLVADARDYLHSIRKSVSA